LKAGRVKAYNFVFFSNKVGIESSFHQEEKESLPASGSTKNAGEGGGGQTQPTGDPSKELSARAIAAVTQHASQKTFAAATRRNEKLPMPESYWKVRGGLIPVYDRQKGRERKEQSSVHPTRKDPE